MGRNVGERHQRFRRRQVKPQASSQALPAEQDPRPLQEEGKVDEVPHAIHHSSLLVSLRAFWEKR